MDFTLVNKTCLCVAKRNSGKSVLCKYLLQMELHKFDEIFCISCTEDLNNFYKDFIDEKNIFTEFSAEWLSAFLNKAELMKKSGGTKQLLLILDDVAMEEDFKKDSTIKKIFCRGRHSNVAIIILQQHLYQISTVCRSNCDYLLVGQLNAKSLDCLADEFLSGNLTKKEFIKLYHKSTTDYYFLLINCNSVKDSNNINSIYAKVKARIENKIKNI